jgi:hypothetical protein
MSSITRTGPLAAHASRYLGLVCLIGGLLWLAFVSGSLGLLLGSRVVEGLIGVLMLLSLMGGPLGLLSLRAAGVGRTGSIGAGVALVGPFSYLVGHTGGEHGNAGGGER